LGEQAYPDTRAGVGMLLRSIGLPVYEFAGVLDLLDVDQSHRTNTGAEFTQNSQSRLHIFITHS